MTEKFGIEKRQARHRLVDGRAADLPLGLRSIPTWSSGSRRSAARPRCSRHNFVFLEGVKAALTADAAWNERLVQRQADKGLRAVARVYAGWGFSQAFYREQLDIKALGYSLAGGLPGRLLGRLLPAEGCQQSADHALDLAERRHQRQRALQRRLQEGARRDQGQGLS